MTAAYLVMPTMRNCSPRNLDRIAEFFAERGRGEVAEERHLALVRLREAALADRHVLPQIAGIGPTGGQDLAVAVARREHQQFAADMGDPGNIADARLKLLREKAAEQIGGIALRDEQRRALLVEALAR